MMVRIFLAGILSVLIFFQEAFAQDAHFSQFQLLPQYLNPAMTGFHNGILRVNGVYRNQWLPVGGAKSAFHSGGLNLDFSLLKNKMDHDYLGIGISGTYDHNGLNVLENSGGMLNLAYSKGFGQNIQHSIAIGLGLELQVKNIQTGNAKFSDGVYETLMPNSTLYDVNTGIRYHAYFPENSHFFAGFAYHHLIGAKDKHTPNSANKLNGKYVAHIGNETKLNEKWGVDASTLFMMQKQSWQLNLGAMGRYYFGDTYYKRENSSNHIGLGLFMRANNTVVDAVIPVVKIEFFAVTVNAAFDINVSGLRKASDGYGAIEVGLGYVMSKGQFNRTNRMLNPDF